MDNLATGGGSSNEVEETLMWTTRLMVVEALMWTTWLLVVEALMWTNWL